MVRPLEFGELRALAQDRDTTPETLVYACLLAPMGQGETWARYAEKARPSFHFHKSTVDFMDVYAWGLSAHAWFVNERKAPAAAAALGAYMIIQAMRKGMPHRARATIAWGDGSALRLQFTYAYSAHMGIAPTKAWLNSRTGQLTMPPRHLRAYHPTNLPGATP